MSKVVRPDRQALTFYHCETDVRSPAFKLGTPLLSQAERVVIGDKLQVLECTGHVSFVMIMNISLHLHCRIPHLTSLPSPSPAATQS